MKKFKKVELAKSESIEERLKKLEEEVEKLKPKSI